MKHLLLLIAFVIGLSASGIAVDTPPTLGSVTVSADSTSLTYQHTGADITTVALDSFELYMNDPAESNSPNPRAWIFVKIFPDATIVSDTIYVREHGSVTWTPNVNY